MEIPIINDEVVELFMEVFLGYFEIVEAVDIGTIVLGRNTTRLDIVTNDDCKQNLKLTYVHGIDDKTIHTHTVVISYAKTILNTFKQ